MESIKARGLQKAKVREAAAGYIFVAPIVIGTVVFSIIPILYSFYLSLQQWDGLGKKVFVGLNNFKLVFSDPLLSRALLNTATYAVGTVPITLLLAIFLANKLNQKIRFKSLFRVVYYLPNVTMAAAVAMVWRWIFNGQYGLLNQILSAFGITGPAWVADPNYIMMAIVIVSCWGGVGYNMVFVLSGMQTIPEALLESARLDGATERQIFWKITMPLITPTLFFLLTMSVMSAIKVFDIVFVLAAGGQLLVGTPVLEASRTIVYSIFENAFSFMKMGLASAQAVVLFFLILIITGLQFLLQKKWVYYD